MLKKQLEILKACGGVTLGGKVYAMLLAQTDAVVLKKQLEIVKACSGVNLGGKLYAMLFAQTDVAMLETLLQIVKACGEAFLGADVYTMLFAEKDPTVLIIFREDRVCSSFASVSSHFASTAGSVSASSIW
jgi:hypothetical protein